MKWKTTKIYSALKSIGRFKTMKSSIHLPFIIKDWLCWEPPSFHDRRLRLHSGSAGQTKRQQNAHDRVHEEC